MPIARWIARRVWWAMLWLMRRRWMRRLQRASVNLFPASKRDAIRESMIRQDRFARRWGLMILQFAILIFLYSLVFTLLFFGLLALIERGYFRVPR